MRAELKITHFREPQVRRVQVNTKLPRKKANYTAVPEFILDKCLVYLSKWWYLRHTRNLTGWSGGISKLEYFVEALKAQVVPIMNNQTLCLHFAQRWASKMHHCLQWLDSTVSNWNKGQSLDFGIACYCPTTIYWAYHLKINAFIGTWWLNQV